MSITYPLHRNYRPVKKDTFNSGYSDWAYIVDRRYSIHPEHYTRTFSILQKDITSLLEYIEPADVNLPTFSLKIHQLLIRTCIEVEANFKAILRENIFNPTDKYDKIKDEKWWNMNDFKIVNVTHHLDDYSVKLPIWRGTNDTRYPFKNWKKGNALNWHQAYNACKHDRFNKFELASLENLLDAFSGLCVLLSSQFRTESFDTGGKTLGIGGYDYYGGGFGIGGFLIVDFPDDWKNEEMYEFNWDEIKKEPMPFRKINYDKLIHKP